MLPGVVRADKKARRGIFASTEPVDASDEKHSPVQASESVMVLLGCQLDYIWN